jgi:hypothetical protein
MLDYVLMSGKVRLQDIAFPLVSLSSSSDEAGRASWDYFRQNFTILQVKYKSGPMWASIVGLSCRGLLTAAGANEVEDFFAAQGGAGSATRRLSQALEVIRTRAKRRDRDREALRAYLTTCAANDFFLSLLA